MYFKNVSECLVESGNGRQVLFVIIACVTKRHESVMRLPNKKELSLRYDDTYQIRNFGGCY
jgi:hypothetical protein